MRIDAMRGEVEQEVFAEAGGDIEDFAFEALEMFEGDVEEIAGAAGGIEHGHFAKLAVESSDLGAGLGGVAFLRMDNGGGMRGPPLAAQGLDDGGQDEPLDVGARSVVRTELVPLLGIEGALQQGAEDGGL